MPASATEGVVIIQENKDATTALVVPCSKTCRRCNDDDDDDGFVESSSSGSFAWSRSDNPINVGLAEEHKGDTKPLTDCDNSSSNGIKERSMVDL